MTKLTLGILLGFSLGFCCAASYAENEPETSLTVLPTSDTSELGLAEPLQYALGQVLQSTGVLKVQLSGYSLNGFTPQDVSKGFDVLQSDLMSFTYMEKTRLSVFLFARTRPSQFIVSYRMLDDAPGGQLTSEFIETRFREAVNEVLTNYNQANFQSLPGAENTTVALDDSEQRQRAEEARILFRELASLENKKWYMGAHIGMARYSQATTATQTMANSTVNFGGYGGAKLGQRMAFEAGANVFSYLLLHGDLRYHIPLLEKYVDISVTGGVGRFMAAVTENRTQTSNVSLVGSMVFGPGLAFDVPLLGATVRGEAKYYFGTSSVLVGSYGVVIAL